MALNVQLTPVDDERLEALERALTDRDEERLRQLLGPRPFFFREREREWLAEVERIGDYPPHRLIPLRLRVESNPDYAEAARWLIAADSQLAFRALVETCRTDESAELPVPYWVLLSYFSEAYRMDVTGLDHDASAETVPYDGDLAVLAGVGGLVTHGDPLWTYYRPVAVRNLASELSRIPSSRYPKGDMAALHDMYEDAGYDPDLLEEDVREGLDFLRELYAEAARRGWGMRIHG